jgi:uncharacterized damage-inducible protein DinB
MTAAEIRQHIRYSGWASRKLLDAAIALSADDRSRPVGVSHGSIEGTLAHIYLADRIWYGRTAEPSQPILRHAAWEAVLLDWPVLQQKWEQWADTLSDADVTRVLSYRTLDGTPFESPVWQIVLHVVNHATLHRGQAVAMIRQLGIKPPTTDLLYYYRELAAAATAP